jgi:hypothetical protein
LRGGAEDFFLLFAEGRGTRRGAGAGASSTSSHSASTGIVSRRGASAPAGDAGVVEGSSQSISTSIVGIAGLGGVAGLGGLAGPFARGGGLLGMARG